MKQQPNILIFQTDQQRWDVCEPDHPCRTPNLDRMAREGLRFDTVMPPMAHCCPSRASLMTGLYPSQHGVWNNTHNTPALSRGLNEGVRCWSESLKDVGYELYFNGKWHVSADEGPKDRGWTEGLVVAGPIPKGTYGMGRPLPKWRESQITDTPPAARRPGQIIKPGWGDYWIYGSREDRQSSYQPNSDKPWDDDTTDARILRSGLDHLKQALANDKPWLSYIGFTGPHDPFIVPSHYARMYNPDKIELPPSWNDSLLDRPAYYRRQKERFDQMSEQEKRECIAHYWGYCTMIDDMFGEVLKTLEEAGELDNTVVIFCSDHGEFLGDHGLYLKGIAPYDGGYKVPFFVRAPGLVNNPGRTCDALVSLMDLAPTLCELAQADPPNPSRLAGRSLLPWLKDDQPQDWRDALYLQCNGTEVYFSSRTVRTNDWKFVYNAVDYDELYDLRNDPHERVNLAADPRYQEIRDQLNRQMWLLAEQAEDSYVACEYHSVSLATLGPKSAL